MKTNYLSIFDFPDGTGRLTPRTLTTRWAGFGNLGIRSKQFSAEQLSCAYYTALVSMGLLAVFEGRQRRPEFKEVGTDKFMNPYLASDINALEEGLALQQARTMEVVA
jgi:hypothetical protein